MKKFLILLLSVFPGFSEADPFVDAVSATVRIMGGGASGTGFLVEKENGKHVLASAAHVFADVKGETCQVLFRKEKSEGRYQRMPVELAIRSGERALWKSHQTHDLAFIAIEVPDGAVVTPFTFAQLAGEGLADEGRVGVGAEVCVPCFPIGTEANAAGWPVLRRGTIATHPLTPLADAETFFIDSSSFGGESGAPVVWWQDDEVHVIGVISSMQRQTEKTKTALEEKVTHLPLGLGIAVQSPFLKALLTE